jgi:ectoine hydroxylase-related dioxygenase (phytanoyl-CoA dioxygenase family)
MQHIELSKQQRESYARRGFIVVPAAFGTDEMATITGWIDEVEAWPEAPGKYLKYYEDSLREPGRRVLNRIENFVPYHAGLASLLLDSPLQDCVSAALGEPAVLFKEKINFKLPGGGGFEPHQDVQAGWDTYAELCVTAMLTIDETTLENGCLELAHWDHRQQMIGDLWQPLRSEQLADIEFVSYPTKPGDLMLFDSFLPHRSAPNPTDKPRRVLYVTYNRAVDGDHRERYFVDKRRSYPQDCEREPGKVYTYKV